MPDRTIRESWLTSGTLMGVSGSAERLFARLILVADAWGRFDADPTVLRSRCFPKADAGQFPPSDVARWFDELRAVTAIVVYACGGRRYGYFPSWVVHQPRPSRSARPSFPPPPAVTGPLTGSAGDGARLPDPRLSGLGGPLAVTPLGDGAHQLDLGGFGVGGNPPHDGDALAAFLLGPARAPTPATHCVTTATGENRKGEGCSVFPVFPAVQETPTQETAGSCRSSFGPASSEATTRVSLPRARAGDAQRLADAFDRFWTGYPRKRDKQTAWEEWCRLRPSAILVDAIIRAVAEQRDWPDLARDGFRFFPYAERWLRKRKWLDEPAPASAPVSPRMEAIVRAHEHAVELVRRQRRPS